MAKVLVVCPQEHEAAVREEFANWSALANIEVVFCHDAKSACRMLASDGDWHTVLCDHMISPAEGAEPFGPAATAVIFATPETTQVAAFVSSEARDRRTFASVINSRLGQRETNLIGIPA